MSPPPPNPQQGANLSYPKASKYSAYSLPLVGAAVGAMVLGPVGAIAGNSLSLSLLLMYYAHVSHRCKGCDCSWYLCGWRDGLGCLGRLQDSRQASRGCKSRVETRRLIFFNSLYPVNQPPSPLLSLWNILYVNPIAYLLHSFLNCSFTRTNDTCAFFIHLPHTAFVMLL